MADAQQGQGQHHPELQAVQMDRRLLGICATPAAALDAGRRKGRPKGSPSLVRAWAAGGLPGGQEQGLGQFWTPSVMVNFTVNYTSFRITVETHL